MTAAPLAHRPGRVGRVPWLAIGVLLVALGFLALVALFISIPLAAAVYGLGLLVLTWFRPELTFLLIFLTAPFAWDLGLGPVKMAASELSLAIAFPVFAFRQVLSGRTGAGSPLKWPVLAYFAACAASIGLNGGVRESLTSMLQMVVYLVVAVYVFAHCVRSPSQVSLALYGFLFVSLALASLVIVGGTNYVLGLHKNFAGSQLAFAVVIGTELWLQRASERRRRLWFTLLLGGLAMGLVLTLSRGAWLGAATGILVILILRRQFRLAVRIGLALIPLISLAWLLVPEEQKDYVTDLGADAHNVRTRLESLSFAYGQFQSSPIYGVGVGLRKTYDATNLVMSTLAETGVVGLATFLSIFATFAWMVWRTRPRIALSDPMFSMMAIGAALMTCKFMHGCVDHYWSRGVLPVWAGAGMAVYAYKTAARAGRLQRGELET